MGRPVKVRFFCTNVENTYSSREHEHKEVSRVVEAVVSDPSSVITVRRKTAGRVVFVGISKIIKTSTVTAGGSVMTHRRCTPP